MNEFSGTNKREARELPFIPPPCEDTATRGLSMKQEVGPHQTLNWLAHVNHPVLHDIFVMTAQTNTNT